jgi:hypothetical protein
VTAWRIAELRQSLGFVRAAYRSLVTGDLPKAFRLYALASRGVFMARAFGGPAAATATATLSRVIANLADDIEDRLAPAPTVHPSELVPTLLESLKVLQRNGVDVDDEALAERARGAATALGLAYRFEAL